MEQEDMTLEEQVAVVEARIANEPRHRLALYRLLGFCEQERCLEEIQEEAASYPEMTTKLYAPRTLLVWLVESGAVRRIVEEDTASEQFDNAAARSEDGEAVDAAGLDYRFVITDAGSKALANHRASRPLAELMEQYPAYDHAFRRVLFACVKPLNRQDVESLFKGDPVMECPRKIYANFFLDKLEASGGLVFAGGWTTTAEGAAFLAEDDAAELVETRGRSYEHMR